MNKISLSAIFLVFCTTILFAQNTRKFSLETEVAQRLQNSSDTNAEIVFQEWYTTRLGDFSSSLWINGFSIDERYLLTSTYSSEQFVLSAGASRVYSEVKIWDVSTGFLVNTIKNVRFPKTWKFLPDSNKIICQVGKSLAYYDILQKEYCIIEENFLIDSYYHDSYYHTGDLHFALSPNKKYLLVANRDNIRNATIYIYDSKSLKRIKKVDLSTRSQSELLYKDLFDVIDVLKYDNIYIWFKETFETPKYYGEDEKGIMAETPSGNLIKIEKPIDTDIIGYDYNSNRISINSQYSQNSIIFDRDFSFQNKEENTYYGEQHKEISDKYIYRSPNGIFAYYLDREKFTTKIYNIKTKKKITVKDFIISFSLDDSLCISGKGDLYDTNTWKVIKKIEAVHSTHELAFSPNKKFIIFIFEGGTTVYFYDIQSNKMLREFEINDITERKDARADGKACLNNIILFDNLDFIYQSKSGIIRKYSGATGNLLGSLSVNVSENAYCVSTKEGYFNSNAVDKFVHVVNGMEVTGLDQLADVYYRPDLVAAKLRGEDITAQDDFVPLNEVIATGDAPTVQFTNAPAKTANRDVTVSFSVQDMGGGVGSVYLSLNGKVIQLQEGSRKFTLEGASVAPKTAGEKTVHFQHTVSLQNGENTLEAYATNSAGVIESRHAQTRIMWQGATAKPNLYVLAVGVNKYRDRSLWLNYSVPDAQSVLANFGGQKTSLYQNIYTSELLDGDVTRENIAAKFAELSPRVKSDDVFIFYVAGHGTAKNGDYYFIPSNFRYTDASAVLAQGISKADILQFMSNIKAGKTVILLDTCNSGAFLNDSGTRGFEEKTAMERLVRATGQAVLMASSDTQSAMEGYEGHGVFTYVLLQALSGKADANRDGYTTLGELASYIEEQVSELSFQKWGYEQVPMKELRKQDFPLVGK